MGEEMEANTCYLGIELNDSYAMVSYMQPNMDCLLYTSDAADE